MPHPADLETPRAQAALRVTLALTAAYLALSIVTLAAVALLRNHHDLVTDAVWVRTVIVVLSAAATVAFASRVARGSRRALLRLRIVAGVMTVAIAVIVAVPGDFPLWLKAEQAVCGLLLLCVSVVAHRELRPVFAPVAPVGATERAE